MALGIPDGMDELVYFTRRKFGTKGSAVAWARRVKCPQCKKGLMSKPVDEKKGTFKTRSDTYVCPKCSYTENKADHEKNLVAEIIYTCPFCEKKGEVTTAYARKSFYGKKAIVFVCESCGEKLGITKKLAIPDEFLKKLS